MPIAQREVDQIRYWSDLLVTMAEGRPEGVAALERMETSDFYFHYKSWKARQEAIIASYKQA